MPDKFASPFDIFAMGDQSIMSRLNKLEQNVSRLQGADIKFETLDEAAPDSGVSPVNDIISGTGSLAGGDLTGIEILYPPYFDGVNNWNMVGMQAGVLHFGINAADGTVYAINGIFDGTIFAHSGTIGGFTITDTYLIQDGATDALSAGMSPSDYPFYAGAKYANRATAPFRVTTAGALFATGATISGAITATSGAIGGWVISATALKDAAGTVGMSSAVTGGDDIRFWAGNVTPASAPFYVTEAGVLLAQSGTIAGWSLSSTTIQKLTASVGIIMDASVPAIKVGNTAGTYVIIDGANQRIVSSNYASGLVGSVWNTAGGDAEFNNVTVRGAIRSTVLQYGYITATNGTAWVTPASGVLRNDCTSVNSPTTFSVNIKDPDGMTHAAAGTLWTIGDIIRLKESVTGDLWASISSKTDNTTYWTLNVVKQQPGAGTNYTFRAGLGVIDYGASGSGFISLSADGSVGASPNITLATHSGSPWTTFSNYMRMGNLNGSYGYAAPTYGVGMGAYGSAGQPSLTLDTTNGLRIFNNTTVRVGISTAGVMTINDSAGTAVFTFDASAGAFITKTLNMSGASAAIAVGATPPTSATVGTGLWMDRTGLYSINANVNQVTINNSGISAAAGKITLNSTGLFIAIDTTLTSTSSVSFTNSGVTQAYLNCYDNGTDTYALLNINTGVFGSNVNRGLTQLQLFAQAKTTNPASVNIGAFNDTYGLGGQANIYILGQVSAGDLSSITLTAQQISAQGPTTLSSTLGVTGATTLSSTLHTVGAATFDSTLGVTGATTLSSTLHTVGAATFDSTLTMSNSVANITWSGGAANVGLDFGFGATITRQSSDGRIKLIGQNGVVELENQVAIGLTSPNATAILHVQSTTLGALLPRMTTTQRNAIAAVDGLIIYNLSTHRLETYDIAAAAWHST